MLQFKVELSLLCGMLHEGGIIGCFRLCIRHIWEIKGTIPPLSFSPFYIQPVILCLALVFKPVSSLLKIIWTM